MKAIYLMVPIVPVLLLVYPKATLPDQLISQTQAQAKAQFFLRLCNVPGPFEVVRAVRDGEERQTALWMMKLKSATGAVYTCLIDARSGSLRQVESSANEPRRRRAGRTGKTIFAGSAQAKGACLEVLDQFILELVCR